MTPTRRRWLKPCGDLAEDIARFFMRRWELESALELFSTAVFTTAARALREKALLELAGGDISKVTTAMVGQVCAADPVAKETMEEIIEYLSIWLGNMVDLLDPDVIIIGGGVSGMLSSYFCEIRKRLPKWCINSRAHEIPLLKARYGADAGIAGGAALCAGSQ